MTNQLTQAELEAFGNLSGLLEVKVAKNENEGFTYRTSGFIRTSQLAKFAQLVQQRQGGQRLETVYAVPIEVDGHDVLYRLQDQPEPMCDNTRLYTANVDTLQLVAQALEKAAEVCMKATPDAEMLAGIGDAAHYVACRDAIRALIDQPVDHIEESLGMVERGGDELIAEISALKGEISRLKEELDWASKGLEEWKHLASHESARV